MLTVHILSHGQHWNWPVGEGQPHPCLEQGGVRVGGRLVLPSMARIQHRLLGITSFSEELAQELIAKLIHQQALILFVEISDSGLVMLRAGYLWMSPGRDSKRPP